MFHVFQSTCPARGTTGSGITIQNVTDDFNPRAPRGARHCALCARRKSDRFQSTCPARGTTSPFCFSDAEVYDFNPRAPRGARLHISANQVFVVPISIHVPREGHDTPRREGGGRIFYFNPRAPRGARLRHQPLLAVFAEQFQSTCPARGTTVEVSVGHRPALISIHVPREGIHSIS